MQRDDGPVYHEQPDVIESNQFHAYLVQQWIRASMMNQSLQARRLKEIWREGEMTLEEEFISLLCDLYKLLQPFIDSHEDISSQFKEDIMRWNDLVAAPLNILEARDSDEKIDELYRVIGRSLQLLGIIKIEIGVKL